MLQNLNNSYLNIKVFKLMIRHAKYKETNGKEDGSWEWQLRRQDF